MVDTAAADPESTGSADERSSAGDQVTDLAELFAGRVVAHCRRIRGAPAREPRVGLRKPMAALERGWRAELGGILLDPLTPELVEWLGDESATEVEVRLGLAQLEAWVDGLLRGRECSLKREARDGPERR